MDPVEAVKLLLRGDATLEFKQNLSGLVPVERHLSDLVPFTLAGGVVNPLDPFRDRKGLWLSQNFQNYILAGATIGSVGVHVTALGYAGLLLSPTDSNIGKELPGGYIFEDVPFFLAILALLIKGQLDGGEGPLLTGYRSNLFYVRVGSEVFVVNVDWFAVYREWRCDADPFGADGRWDAGDRAFSATVA
jgi:hypothetical protein